MELVNSWLPATQRIEESLSDHFSCCPAGSGGIKVHVIQKCKYPWEQNSQGKAVPTALLPAQGGSGCPWGQPGAQSQAAELSREGILLLPG